MNQHSYRYELITNKKGMFDKYIDMVYLITMEDSPRREHYMNQINKYIPHKNITIQHNKGFKNADKKLWKKNTISDLNDAYYHAFLNSLQNNYKNIIIFEDDFFFDDTINQYIVDDIGQFITNNPYHIYHLGSLFHISIPTFSSLVHLKSYFVLSSHCVIYNRDYAYYYIKNYEKGFTMQNDHRWSKLEILKYIYYKPLCFQLCENTENRQNWLFSENIIKILEYLKLDKTHSPGYTILNIVSYIVSFHVIFIFLYFYL
uniref:Uncharacterized protein n=1 Tax=viral metagenome TaxID=1070528 RepID=A0A6C0HW95_9ZZZZ